MDTRTGEIAAYEEMKKRMSAEEFEQYAQEIDPALLSPRNRQQLEASGRTRISRNSPCVCGNGKRFKRCCMDPFKRQP